MTIAWVEMATTRPVRLSGTSHASDRVAPVFVFSVTRSPTAGADATVENDGRRPVPLCELYRLRYQLRAAGMSGVRTRRSLSRRRSSKPLEDPTSAAASASGVRENEGAVANVRFVSGVVTAETPCEVNESEAMCAYTVSALNGTS